jgi:acyl carrier protein
MNAEEIQKKVVSIVADHLGIEEREVKGESSFTDDLGADSLDLVEVVMSLEEVFGLEIADDQAEKIKTVNDAVSYISSHLAQ